MINKNIFFLKKALGLIVSFLFFLSPILKFENYEYLLIYLNLNPALKPLFLTILILFSIYFLFYLIDFFLKNNRIFTGIHFFSLLSILCIYASLNLIFKNINFIFLRGSICLFIFLIFEILIALMNLFDTFSLKVKDIVEIGILVSSALVLDLPFFKIRFSFNGGSISLNMLPLVFLALKQNFFKSFIGIGIVYGISSCLIDGYGFIFFPFDYLLGFGSLAIISLFSKFIFNKNMKKINSYLLFLFSLTLSVFLRLVMSSISSILIYNFSLKQALIYQISYIGPSFLLLVALCTILFKSFGYFLRKY